MGRVASWDIPGSLVAVALIAADVVLRMTGHDAAAFDATIPVITALYLGGRVAAVAVHAVQQNGGSTVQAQPPPAPVPAASTAPAHGGE